MIQAILFDNHTWTAKEARKWLHNNNFHPIKPAHRTTNMLRYRLIPPEQFKRFTTKKLDNGIELVIGYIA